jgi:GNAT superfamily N-acetyltransferase
LGPDRAEIALEVVDAAQRRGVGGALLRALTSRAAKLGYASFEASVLSTNRPVLELMRKTFGTANVRYEGPVVHLELSTVD